ncbi:restriction endonuclease subunit S [Pusillimonas sp. (ex Stolz et al. 2005)]|uniref:restriction endonuclease subunit S n=1 Tax=Pusillimonas sp. (ex Stolz et al. 2005) TaxID=1979962 RepID=UPI0026156E7F|nr:restriction endonuclease subunit S [Pusillimonas sp. (ex Stolz et al. 2005)]
MSSVAMSHRLGDLTDWFSGGTPSKKKPEYWGEDIPWISASSMGGSRYFDSDLKITTEGLEAGSRLAPKGSILLLVRGSTLHKRIPVGIAEREVAFNQDVKAIRVKPELIAGQVTDELYLYYWLKANEQLLLEMVEHTGIGAGKLDTKRLQNLEIELPPWHEQRKIVTTATALDEKEILNSHINQTLEQMAQAIFKSWFVDFEPVKAKIAALEAGGSEEDALLAAMQAVSGKGEPELTRLQAEQPEQYTELRATAELFPSAMQDSELGEIPEGWESGLLNDICEFQNGYAFKSKDWSDSGFAVVKIGSVKPAFVDIQSCSYVADKTIAGLERFELFPGDLLVGMTGYPGETGLVPKTENRVFLNQRVGRLKPKQNNLKALLYCNVRDPDFKQYVEGQAHGSAQANVSGKAIGHYPITIPTGSVVEQFSALIDPLLQQKLNLNAEAMSLAITRDTLLPKLLSGEVSAPEIKDPSQEASRHSDIGDGVAFDE